MRAVESAFLVIGMLATASAAQLTVIPTARDVTPVKSTVTLRLSPDKVRGGGQEGGQRAQGATGEVISRQPGHRVPPTDKPP